MRRYALKRLVLAAVAAGMAAGCGVGSATSGPGGGGGGGGGGQQGSTADYLRGPNPQSPAGPAIPNASRMATFKAVEAELMATKAEPVNQRNRDVLAFLARRPEFAEIGAAPDGSLWARFTDNRYYIINDTLANNSAPPGKAVPMQPAKSPALSVAVQPIDRGARGVEPSLPSSSYALVMSTLGSGFPAPTSNLVPMLQKRRYSVTQVDASVEQLKHVQNPGVFAITTHGGVAGNNIRVDQFWGLFTSTPVTDGNDTTYHDDLAVGRLVYFEAANDITLGVIKSYSTDYAITARFITFYNWTFAKHAVAFVNACWSDADGFTTALGGLTAHPGAIAGWSNAAGASAASDAATYFFDRLLGTNTAQPREASNQRPFDVGAVYADMKNKGLAKADTTTYGPSQLVVRSFDAGIGQMLVPAITYMEVQERYFEEPAKGETKLTLHGFFGSDTGSVTVGGTQAAVNSWSTRTIECKLQSTHGAGSGGLVQVSGPTGVCGNSVPLSVWHGTFTYAGILIPNGGTSLQVNVFAYFRADLHGYRSAIGGQLQYQANVPFRASAGSQCEWHTIGPPPASTSWILNNLAMPYGLHGQDSPLSNGTAGIGYILEGTLDHDSGAVAISYEALGVVASINAPNVGRVWLAMLQDPTIISLPSGVQAPDGAPEYTPKLHGTIGADGTIAAKTTQGTTLPALGITFKWTSMSASPALDESKGEDYGL